MPTRLPELPEPSTSTRVEESLESKCAAARRRLRLGYFCAVILPAMVLLVRLTFSGGPPMLILFLLPVMIAAYLGGWRTGLLATVTTGALVKWFVLAPIHSFAFARGQELLLWLTLIVAAVLTSALNGALLHARRRAESNEAKQSGLLIKTKRMLAHAQDLLETAPDSIVIADRSGNIVMLNQQAEKDFGFQRNDLLGQPMRIVLSNWKNEPAGGNGQPHNQPSTREMSAFRKKGGQFPVEVSVSPLETADGLLWINTIRDVTERRRREGELRLFRALIDRMPDVIEVIDPATGRFLDVNEKALQTHGYTREEYLSRTVFDMDPKTVLMRNHWRENIEGLRTTRFRRLESEHRRKDGSLFPVEINVSLIQLDREYMVAVVRDITERKETEQRLRQNEQQLHEVMRHTHCIVNFGEVVALAGWRENPMDLHTHLRWKFPVVNEEAAQEMFPLEVKPGENYQHAWVRSRNTQDHCRINRDSGTALLRDAPSYTSEFRCTDKNGVEHWMQQHVTVRKLEENRWQVFGITTDVTERQKVEKQIAEDQARFKLIFDRIPVGIAFHTVHPNGTITRSINHAHLRIAGITLEEHNQPEIYTRISHPDDHAIQRQYVEQVKSGAISHYSMEKRYVHRDGKIVWVNFSYQRETYPDGTQVELTTVVDITAQKLLAEQLRQSQKMEAVGQLSGGIAHDFNNILCVIIGQASMLQMGALNPGEQANALQQIVQSAERAANLTRQLLAFSRRQIIQTRPLDLNEATSSMIKMLQRLIGEHIVLQTRYASESAMVQADPGMIEQVLLNLAVNARDAMPNGGEIFIETQPVRVNTPAVREKGLGPDFIRLSVRDTGCGIAPEHLPRIFEPFFTTKEVGKGTGLGLATVFGIIEQHQGWIEVQSELGKGTTFDIYLPRLRKAELAAMEQPMSLPVPGNGETILMVEDEAALRALTRNTLERLGYKVLEASAGRMAFEIWKQHPEIQLLVTDLVMPEGISGRELAAQLLEQRPKLKVIYMSGYPSDLAGRGLSLREGVNFLQKPFSPIKLAEIVGLAVSTA